MAKAITNEISKADWSKLWGELWGFYLGAKRNLTEHADPDQIDAHFPPDVLAGDGSMVGYYEILPYAKPVEFTLGAQTWLLDDQHCVRANCSCQEAALSFFELRPSAQHSGIGSEPTLCIRYAYDTGQIEPLSGAKDGRWSGQDFVDALREVLPDLDPVLAKRQALLLRLYRRALSRKTIRLQAPKPGRNERCPCGSGKSTKSVVVLDAQIVAARCPVPRTMNLNCIHCSYGKHSITAPLLPNTQSPQDQINGSGSPSGSCRL